jgi:hypothetical protein
MSTSILSNPAPARRMSFNDSPASIVSVLTFVDLTIQILYADNSFLSEDAEMDGSYFMVYLLSQMSQE